MSTTLPSFTFLQTMNKMTFMPEGTDFDSQRDNCIADTSPVAENLSMNFEEKSLGQSTIGRIEIYFNENDERTIRIHPP